MFSKGRCLVIAEIAQAHDGSLGMAHAYIDAVARTGADAVKFQTHFADYESSTDEPFRVKFSPQDATRYGYWKRLEFSPEQWVELSKHARQCGLYFLSSPFSAYAVEVLEHCGVPAWKVASGELSNLPLLNRMCATGKPIILSSGMSGWQELDTAVERVCRSGNLLCVMQCTTAYPCPPERVGLNVLQEMRRRYNSLVGLSDHSGTIWPAVAATVFGADAFEVHVTFDRAMFGPDVAASLTLEELSMAVSGVRFVEAMLANPVDKDATAASYDDLREMFSQGLVAAHDLPAGTLIGPDSLSTRKPLRGIPACQYDAVLGRRLRVAVSAGTPLEEAHLQANEPDEVL